MKKVEITDDTGNIIKVDIDPENEICEKNALLEKIIGS